MKILDGVEMGKRRRKFGKCGVRRESARKKEGTEESGEKKVGDGRGSEVLRKKVEKS